MKLMPVAVQREKYYWGTSGLSSQYELVSSQVSQISNDYFFPITRQYSNFVLSFYDLSFQWKKDTSHFSLASQRAMHPAYQRIIGMGEKALPLIFRELQRDPDHWFWALKSITGEDPVQNSIRGKFNLMVNSWLDWGKKQGYEC